MVAPGNIGLNITDKRNGDINMSPQAVVSALDVGINEKLGSLQHTNTVAIHPEEN